MQVTVVNADGKVVERIDCEVLPPVGSTISIVHHYNKRVHQYKVNSVSCNFQRWNPPAKTIDERFAARYGHIVYVTECGFGDYNIEGDHLQSVD